jgi:hypothetical protein
MVQVQAHIRLKAAALTTTTAYRLAHLDAASFSEVGCRFEVPGNMQLCRGVTLLDAPCSLFWSIVFK